MHRDASLSPAAVDAQNDAARGLPIRFVDMNDQICATPRCPVIRNGAIAIEEFVPASWANALTAADERVSSCRE